MCEQKKRKRKGDISETGALLDGLKIPDPAETLFINRLPAAPRDRSFGRADLILRE